MVNHRGIILSAVILAAVTPGLYSVSHAAEEITNTSRKQGMAKAPDLVKAVDQLLGRAAGRRDQM